MIETRENEEDDFLGVCVYVEGLTFSMHCVDEVYKFC